MFDNLCYQTSEKKLENISQLFIVVSAKVLPDETEKKVIESPVLLWDSGNEEF